jgi:catechol 2,3-dioxygenase
MSADVTHVARTDLRVDDAPAAAGFYRDVVGLDGERELRAAGGRVLLTLRDDGVAGPAPVRATGLFHVAVRFPARADLASALRRVAGAGARLSGASDHGVSEALYLADPAGNGVELYWDRPRDVWPADMFTAPLDLGDLLAAGPDPGDPVAPPGTDIGHVHLKVADLERAVTFYAGELGLAVEHRYGAEAAFLAANGYHHHVGLNTWMSLGAAPAPDRLAGLDRVAFAAEGRVGTLRDPDGVEVELVRG